MTRLLAPDELAARTARAVDAAAAAARELRLPVADPKILHDAFSVVVHLAPSPVVARIQVVLPRSSSTEEQQRRQQRELDVTSWLATRGVDVVPPSPLVPCRPFARDGFSMTFWQLVDVVKPAEADYFAAVPRVPALHAALREYPARLPFLSPVSATVPSGLTYLKEHPGLLRAEDLERAEREWALLAPVLTSEQAFAERFPHVTLQTIHGDAPSYNVIETPSGSRYADFEDVTVGPPEWDLALFGPQAVAAYDGAAASAGFRVLDPGVMRVMDTTRALQVIACLALVPELPMLAQALLPIVEQWRALPFAGGLT
jgi:hypothetical protein